MPRACVIGGKAAPGYERAKKIIKLVNAVGTKVNSDPDIGDLLKVVFVPDYNVSLAEILIPGQTLRDQQPCNLRLTLIVIKSQASLSAELTGNVCMVFSQTHKQSHHELYRSSIAA